MFSGIRNRIANGLDRMAAKRPVTFKLRFAKPLIRRRLLRERLAGGMIVQHVSRLISVQGGLKVNKKAIILRVTLRAGAAIGPVDTRVANHTERAVVVSDFGITTE